MGHLLARILILARNQVKGEVVGGWAPLRSAVGIGCAAGGSPPARRSGTVFPDCPRNPQGSVRDVVESKEAPAMDAEMLVAVFLRMGNMSRITPDVVNRAITPCLAPRNVTCSF